MGSQWAGRGGAAMNPVVRSAVIVGRIEARHRMKPTPACDTRRTKYIRLRRLAPLGVILLAMFAVFASGERLPGREIARIICLLSTWCSSRTSS